jgi:hypothetical protein
MWLLREFLRNSADFHKANRRGCVGWRVPDFGVEDFSLRKSTM